jgi:hypothetical protein
MKPFNFFVLVSVTLFMISCNKSQDEGTGVGDAIIIVKKIGTNTVYGISLYAYSFDSFQSVKATSSVDTSKTDTLKENQEYKTNFVYEPSDAEFTITKPVATTYNFTAVFENGVTDEFTDDLTASVLSVPVLEMPKYDVSTSVLTMAWSAVTYADSYAVTILDGSKVVFSSLELSNTQETYSVSSTSGWATGYPVVGETYAVRLNAYLYEPSGDSYNMQAVSFAEEKIVWGK